MIRDEREVKRRERETRPRKGTRRNSSTIDDRGKLSRVGFKGGRGEKYPRTVSRLFVEGPCCDSARGERCTLVQREIGRGIFTRRSRPLLVEELEHHHQYRCIRDYPRDLDSSFCDRREWRERSQVCTCVWLALRFKILYGHCGNARR